MRVRLAIACGVIAASIALACGCSPVHPQPAPVDTRFWDTAAHVQSADDGFSVNDAANQPFAGRYFYQQLPSNLQQDYRSLYWALLAHAPDTSYAGDYAEEMQLVARSLFMDCPEFFYASMRGDYVSDGTSTRYNISYEYDLDETLRRTPLVNAGLQEAYQAAASQPDAASQMWALVVYLANHIDYHWDAAATPDEQFYESYFDTNTLYGALVDGHALCGGYALAFEDVCYRLGIPCVYVEGEVLSDTYSGAHAWNLVQVDGTWYSVDPTWSDDEAYLGLRDDYFMASDAYHNEYVTGLYVPAEVPQA